MIRVHPLHLLVHYPYLYAHWVASPFSSVDNVLRTPAERLTWHLALGTCVCVDLSVCMYVHAHIGSVYVCACE